MNNKEPFSIRGYEVLNTKESVELVGMTEGGFVKRAQRAGLRKLRTSERPGETFYTRVQLEAFMRLEPIPEIALPEQQREPVDVSWLISLIGDALKEARSVAEKIARGEAGREVALAITKLQEAKHWAVDAHCLLGQESVENLSNEAKLLARHAKDKHEQ